MSQIYQGQLLGHQERYKLARKIGERARYKELIEVDFNNATASYVETREFQGLTEMPLSLCWYLGTIDADGSIEDDQATLVPNGTTVTCLTGVTASHEINADEFRLSINFSGISGANVRKAYFYYIAFYDAPFNPALVFSQLSIQYVVPNGLASAEAFGTARIVHEIEPSGIASAGAFGTAKIINEIEPSGIASGMAFGTATVTGTGDDFGLLQNGDNILLQNGDDLLLQ